MTLRKRVYWKLKAQALDHTLRRTPLEEAIDLSSENMVIIIINTHGENRIRITLSH